MDADCEYQAVHDGGKQIARSKCSTTCLLLRRCALFFAVLLLAWHSSSVGGAPVQLFSADVILLSTVGASGEELVKAHSWCNSYNPWKLGTFESVSLCADAVKEANGKYFSYQMHMALGNTFIGGGCYIHYTQSRSCDEGFRTIPSNYNFYDIPEVENWSHCFIDIINVTYHDAHSDGLGQGLLFKPKFQDGLTFARYQTKQSRMFALPWRRLKVCSVKYTLSCSARIALVTKWVSCCYTRKESTCDSTADWGIEGEAATLDKSGVDGSSWQSDDIDDSVDIVGCVEANFSTQPEAPLSFHRPKMTMTVVSRDYEMREVYDDCPEVMKSGLHIFFALIKKLYRGEDSSEADVKQGWITRMLHKAPSSSILDPDVFDTYTLAMTAAVIHEDLTETGGANLPAEERFNLSRTQALTDRYVVFHFSGSPTYDIDELNSSQYVRGVGCLFDALRTTPFDDGFQSGANDWGKLLSARGGANCPYGLTSCDKMTFIQGVFNYTTLDGDPVYPQALVDFRRHFYTSGNLGESLWADGLERYIAFEHLGSHNLKPLTDRQNVPSAGGASAAYVVDTLDLTALTVRDGFGRVGAAMYFTADRQPIMIKGPGGREIWKHQVNDITWQYWKFAWRSSVFLRTTLIDHLYATHYNTAGMLSASAREGLPALHPLRRLLNIFTWFTIHVNNNALHQLVGGKHLLDRSTPFADFRSVTLAAEAKVPSLKTRFEAFTNASHLDATVRSAPYYQDGQLLYDALDKLSNDWIDLYSSRWCGEDGNVKDDDILYFFSRGADWSMTAGSRDREDAAWLGLVTGRGEFTCAGLRKWLAVVFFGVTGYHRHVGTVGDYAKDPDFAAFSWQDNQAYGSPRQHLQMALIAATTSLKMAKIKDDYTFVTRGIDKENEAANVLKEFKASMHHIANVIDRRNEHRQIPYLNMHPGYVECAVSV